MLSIFISILCSVSVSVLLKLAPRWQLDIRQVVAGNYAVAAVLCWLLFSPSLSILTTTNPPAVWVVLIGLGVLLPSLFLVLATSVKQVGVMRTDAAQRLSLLIPLIAAFSFFGEALTPYKLTGIALGLLAIVLIVQKPDNTAQASSKRVLLWPATVFVGTGIIDILFKQMARLIELPFTHILFGVFIIALVLSTIYIATLYLQNKASWHPKNLLGAAVLGSLNFGNIYFYVRAHQQLSQSPALVFSTMNIGVIVLASLIGWFAFKERLATLGKIGLAMAILAVVLLAKATF